MYRVAAPAAIAGLAVLLHGCGCGSDKKKKKEKSEEEKDLDLFLDLPDRHGQKSSRGALRPDTESEKKKRQVAPLPLVNCKLSHRPELSSHWYFGCCKGERRWARIDDDTGKAGNPQMFDHGACDQVSLLDMAASWSAGSACRSLINNTAGEPGQTKTIVVRCPKPTDCKSTPGGPAVDCWYEKGGYHTERTRYEEHYACCENYPSFAGHGDGGGVRKVRDDGQACDRQSLLNLAKDFHGCEDSIPATR